jgi:type I restriction-modification system DNA methylase subunit
MEKPPVHSFHLSHFASADGKKGVFYTPRCVIKLQLDHLLEEATAKHKLWFRPGLRE